jgi:hypothetical protein
VNSFASYALSWRGVSPGFVTLSYMSFTSVAGEYQYSLLTLIVCRKVQFLCVRYRKLPSGAVLSESTLALPCFFISPLRLRKVDYGSVRFSTQQVVISAFLGVWWGTLASRRVPSRALQTSFVRSGSKQGLSLLLHPLDLRPVQWALAKYTNPVCRSLPWRSLGRYIVSAFLFVLQQAQDQSEEVID